MGLRPPGRCLTTSSVFPAQLWQSEAPIWYSRESHPCVQQGEATGCVCSRLEEEGTSCKGTLAACQVDSKGVFQANQEVESALHPALHPGPQRWLLGGRADPSQAAPGKEKPGPTAPHWGPQDPVFIGPLPGVLSCWTVTNPATPVPEGKESAPLRVWPVPHRGWAMWGEAGLDCIIRQTSGTCRSPILGKNQ